MIDKKRLWVDSWTNRNLKDDEQCSREHDRDVALVIQDETELSLFGLSAKLSKLRLG